MPLAPGTRIGSYEVTSLLGKGGMGEVYRARDLKLKREVAIKVLPSTLADNRERLQRFIREAEVLASLNHPNIAQIYGLEETDGVPAIVLELVEGETLGEVIKRGPIPLDTAISYAKQILSAFEYAHDRPKPVIHRDLKPANVKITPEGVAKVLDFGLAKALAEERSEIADPEMSPTLTLGPSVVGVILGTAGYMSPEQAKGKTTDRRADIWSFGVLLYEMVTGQRLFTGEDMADVLAAVIHKDLKFDNVPARVRRVIERCLRKDPRKRWYSMEDIRFALDEGESEALSSSVIAVAPGASRRAWMPWAAATLVLGIATVGLGFVAFRHNTEPPPRMMRFEIHAPPGATLPLTTPAPSPDGSMIAYTVHESDGKRRIHVRPIGALETRVLPGTEGSVHPFWSPDSKSIAFVVGGNTLKRVELAGGAPRELGKVNAPWQGDWHPTGGILVLAGTGVARLSPGGGSQPEIVAPNTGHPSWLPDGKRFLVRSGNSLDSEGIELRTLGSKSVGLVLPIKDSAPVFAAIPDGGSYLLYLRASDLVAQAFDPSSGKVTGEPSLVAGDIGRVASPNVKATMGVSPSGILAYQTGSSVTTDPVSWVDRSGHIVQELPQEASGADPELSPDGKSMSVLRAGAEGVNLWVVDLSRNSASRITFVGTRRGVWSPDGKQIVYAESTLDAKVHIVAVAEPSRTQPLPSALQHGFSLPNSWSPDGKFLIGRAAGKTSLVALEGDAKPMPIGSANGNSDQARMSPDGKYIAYRSDESGQQEVYVQSMPPATGRWKISINGGAGPRWRADGRELYFLKDRSMMAVDIAAGPTFSAGIPHELFHADFTRGNYSVRADGKQFLVNLRKKEEKDDHPITVLVNWWVGLKQ